MIYPYLVRGMSRVRTRSRRCDGATMQVHCTDITYIPMARGFVYLAGNEFNAACLCRSQID
jgi:hypothetical protein